ncbi:unnamed protein product [Owenia fusiformis]|uniref:SRCR domain-containing protein n=1 Tax=Owenia fusiformis TaxID=6347 RepID=A0A8S4NJQ0_OWEFU|nr:unnamed protein product [Owenia fusiformis]
MRKLLIAIFGSVFLTTVRSVENIRLVGGTTENEGRVEIQVDGVWGTICDDHWDLRDAIVVCRELGLGISRDPIVHKNAYFGEGSGPIHIRSLKCKGTENSFEECEEEKTEPCKHVEDAGVTCMPDEPTIKSRLVYGNPNYGQLEIYRGGKWNGVCARTGDDEFTQEDASVVCKELGFSGTAAASTSDVFPILRSSGLDIEYFMQEFDVLRQVTLSAGCQGDEDTLDECNPTVNEELEKCSERIVITCGEVKQEDTVKLVGGDTQERGNLLVLKQGIWLPLLDYLFNEDMAKIVCRQLGNSVTEAPYGYSTGYFGKSESLLFWATAGTRMCDANDAEIQSCIWGDTNRESYYRHGAGVDCNPTGNAQYRLVGGNDDSAGILEVLHDGEWGTICNNSRLPVKSGVCSSLGYKDEDIRFVESQGFANSGSKVWLSGMFCFGDAPLRWCAHNGWGVTEGCDKNQNSPIAVSCSSLLKDDIESKCAKALSQDYKQVGTCTNEADDLTVCMLRCRGPSTFTTALQGKTFACGKSVNYEWFKYDNGVVDNDFKLPECTRIRKKKRSKKTRYQG